VFYKNFSGESSLKEKNTFIYKRCSQEIEVVKLTGARRFRDPRDFKERADAPNRKD
jgi:hypothetical protein